MAMPTYNWDMGPRPRGPILKAKPGLRNEKQRVTTGINGHDDSEEHCISLDTRAQWLQYVCAEVAKELQLYLTCVLCSAMLLSTPVAKTALLERSLMPQSPFPTKQPRAMIHAAGIPGSHSLHSQLPGANTNTLAIESCTHQHAHSHAKFTNL